MAMKPPIFTKGDISSSVAATRGAAMAAEQATMGLNPSKHKREDARLTANSTGATPVELTVLGQPSFRVRLLQSSTVLLTGLAVYHSSVSRVAFQVTIAAQNIDGVLSFIGAPLYVKYGAATATFVATLDNATESLVFTGTGVAGDANGHWDFYVNGFNEVTEDAR